MKYKALAGIAEIVFNGTVAHAKVVAKQVRRARLTREMRTLKRAALRQYMGKVSP